MKNNKFTVLVGLVVAWLGVFLLTMKVKSPRLEQIDLLILFVCFVWFAYWTVSTIRDYFRERSSKANLEATIDQLKKQGHAFTETDTMIIKKNPSVEATPTKNPYAKTKKTSE